MMDFMTWSEMVDDLLHKGHLTRAAIFDLQGVRVAASEGVAISEEEAQGLLQGLQVPIHSSHMFSLFVGGVGIRFLRLDDCTLIGRTSNEVFVAHRTDNVLICGYTSLEEESSCLGSVKDFALKLDGMQTTSEVVGAAPSLI